MPWNEGKFCYLHPKLLSDFLEGNIGHMLIFTDFLYTIK